MKQEIFNINNKSQYHGYQEWYYDNKLFFRGNFKDDEEIGYVESNWYTIGEIGSIGTEFNFHIK